MKVLVTGAGGFLGFEIARQLKARGDTVRSVQRGSYDKLATLGVEQVRGDLADASACLAATERVDAVIHVAAKAGVWGTEAEYVRSNITATQALLDACVKNGVRFVVHTSTPSVTFDGKDAVHADETLPIPETHLFHYGRTKAVAEKTVKAHNGKAHKNGSGQLWTTSLRPHLVFGPGDPHILPRMIQRARSGRMAIIGDGENLVDVTYVDNAALAHLQALDALAQPERRPAGNAYFISQGTPVHPKAWLNRILKDIGVPTIERHVSLPVAYAVGALCEGVWRAFSLKGEPLMTRYVAAQLGTSHHYNLAAAQRDFGYRAVVDDDTAHARTVAWLKAEVAAGRL